MKSMHDVQLPVSIFKEGKAFIAYSPALDISTAGSTIKEVKKNFEEIVQLFFEETEEKGTTADALASLGWEKVDSSNSWIPPLEVEHVTATFSVPA